MPVITGMYTWGLVMKILTPGISLSRNLGLLLMPGMLRGLEPDPWQMLVVGPLCKFDVINAWETNQFERFVRPSSHAGCRSFEKTNTGT